VWINKVRDPDELASLMFAYFEAAVGGCIHRTEGTVAKYLGDGIFAFWNAPDPQHDHALRACQAAVRFRELNARPSQGRQLHTRLGLQMGFRRVLQLPPDDGPAQFYLKQIAERAAEPVSDQWATFTVLKEK
jgi:class 3 adenylate cyclase